MSTIDFTKIHPRTALWFEQRETCRKCRFCFIGDIASSQSRKYSGGGWNCTVSVDHHAPEAPGFVSCMTARDEGRVCGPDAKLFQPKE